MQKVLAHAGAFIMLTVEARYRMSTLNFFGKVRLWCLAALLSAAWPFSQAQTAQPSAETHCTVLRENEYRCNREAFLKRLQHARTVRIDTDRMDLFAAGEIRRLAPNLGLTVVTSDQRPDLIFDLAPVDRSGRVDFGPADVPLATLSVYDPAKGSGRRSLIWVETFTGQQDRPWPSVVTQLLQQFQEHALSH